MDKVPMTLDGFERLEEELKRLKTVERPEIIKAIATAREHGDLSENAEYHAAKERQSFNEGRISEIENKIANAEIIDVSKLSGKIVKFGAKIRLTDEDTDKNSACLVVGERGAEKAMVYCLLMPTLARA
jgi:transcription elongation factor GreA